jgi:heme-degrading monooxygenase HmoA
MITRLWRGRTATTEDADAYVELLTTKVLPELRGIKGHSGAYVLRREIEGVTEFVVITLFDSIDAVRAFAGEDYEVANVSPEARRLLCSSDRTAAHYETVVEPG